MEQHLDFSGVAVTFQALGAFLLAIVMAHLARIFSFSWVRSWAVGWGALSIALAAVRLWIYAPIPVFAIVYLVAEWIFVGLLWLGCVELTRDLRASSKFAVYATPPAVGVAALMVHFTPSFNDLFSIEAVIVCLGAAAAFFALGRVSEQQRTAGWRTMRLALLALGVLYGTYAPLFVIHTHVRPLPVLNYSSLVDLLAGLFLGCAMILVTADAQQQKLNRAMIALDEARGALEQRLHIDPLTDAMSRYAFQAMQRGEEIATGGLTGVTAVFDIDDLKRINDSYGHASGDLVIRAAATAIRDLIRAEDLLFRWGGDEFVVIVPSLSAKALRDRLAPLHASATARSASGEEIAFHISWGEAEFGPNCTIDDAIRQADSRMYDSRKPTAEL